MNTALVHQTRPDEANQPDQSGLSAPESTGERQTLDRTLTEIRSGRRLEKIVASIESFLHSQVARLEKALDQCERAVDNDRILQTILNEFEFEKQAWEEKRKAEILRLNDASEKLTQGWKQLEDDRRGWLDDRDRHSMRKPR